MKSLMAKPESRTRSGQSEVAELPVSDNQIAAAGVIRLNMACPEGVSSYMPGTGESSLTKDMLEMLRRDGKDFEEIAWHYNEDMNGGEGGASGANFNDSASQRSVYSGMSGLQSASSAPNSHFYNVKKLLVQERGEDIYYHLATQKRQGAQVEIADRLWRRQIGLQANHFTRDEDKADYDLAQMQRKRGEHEQRLQTKREEQARVNAARVVRYEVRRPVKCIQNILTTWITQQEKLLRANEEAAGDQKRERSNSQDCLATAAPLIEDEDVGPEDRNAMSQHVDNNSNIDE